MLFAMACFLQRACNACKERARPWHKGRILQKICHPFIRHTYIPPLLAKQIKTDGIDSAYCKTYAR